MKIDEGLLPCPLCGGTAVDGMPTSDDGGQYIDRWSVECSECGLTITLIHTEGDIWPDKVWQKVRDAWNRRPPELSGDLGKDAMAFISDEQKKKLGAHRVNITANLMANFAIQCRKAEPSAWVRVSDRLPEENGWYEVTDLLTADETEANEHWGKFTISELPEQIVKVLADAEALRAKLERVKIALYDLLCERDADNYEMRRIIQYLLDFEFAPIEAQGESDGK